MTDITEVAAHNLNELRKLQTAITVVVETLETDLAELREKRKRLRGNVPALTRNTGKVNGIEHALLVLKRAELA